MASAKPPHAEALDGHERARRLMEQYTEIAGLAGGLAHEIKNPLSTIRLNLELLAEDLQDSEATRDRRGLVKIRVIQRECLHLQEILDDFLRFARVKDVRLKAENLNDVVEEVVRFYDPQALQHGIEIRPYFAADLPLVLLDRPLFQQALLNLMLNAQAAMPKGGHLTFQTYRQPNAVTLDVIDTGCGMSDETLGNAFRAFFSTKPEGSGLGLPTARKIIEAHEGTISVDSAVGRGTRFTLSLPLADLGSASAEAGSSDRRP